MTGTTGTTSSKPLWSILIATLGRRQFKFQRLLDHLLAQADKHPGLVEVVAYHNNGELGLGDIRQALLMDARGDYVSFVDDDDWVDDGFISSILGAMEEKPDVVSFWVSYYEDGFRGKMCYLTITTFSHDTATASYRDLTHVQPLRVELARLGDFREGWPEDFSWRRRVRPHVETEAKIDQVMYEYWHSRHDSVQRSAMALAHGRAQQLHPDVKPVPRPDISHPCFRWCGD